MAAWSERGIDQREPLNQPLGRRSGGVRSRSSSSLTLLHLAASSSPFSVACADLAEEVAAGGGGDEDTGDVFVEGDRGRWLLDVFDRRRQTPFVAARRFS